MPLGATRSAARDNLSGATDPDDRAVHARLAERRDRRGCWRSILSAAPRPERDRRQPAGRRHHHRHEGRGARGARRLHAAVPELEPRGRAGDVQEPRLRSAQGFAPVANVAWKATGSRSCRRALPVRTMPEFIAYAKANPGKLNFGFGQGTAPQLVGEWFKTTQRARRRQRALSRRRAGDHRHAGRPHPSQHRHHHDAGAADQARASSGALGLGPGALCRSCRMCRP